MTTIDTLGYRLTIDDDSNLAVSRRTVDTTKPGDHGADPMGNGMYRMVPSGDIVDTAERNRRLSR